MFHIVGDRELLAQTGLSFGKGRSGFDCLDDYLIPEYNYHIAHDNSARTWTTSPSLLRSFNQQGDIEAYQHSKSQHPRELKEMRLDDLNKASNRRTTAFDKSQGAENINCCVDSAKPSGLGSMFLSTMPGVLTDKLARQCEALLPDAFSGGSPEYKLNRSAVDSFNQYAWYLTDDGSADEFGFSSAASSLTAESTHSPDSADFPVVKQESFSECNANGCMLFDAFPPQRPHDTGAETQDARDLNNNSHVPSGLVNSASFASWHFVKQPLNTSASSSSPAWAASQVGTTSPETGPTQGLTALYLSNSKSVMDPSSQYPSSTFNECEPHRPHRIFLAATPPPSTMPGLAGSRLPQPSQRPPTRHLSPFNTDPDGVLFKPDSAPANARSLSRGGTPISDPSSSAPDTDHQHQNVHPFHLHEWLVATSEEPFQAAEHLQAPLLGPTMATDQETAWTDTSTATASAPGSKRVSNSIHHTGLGVFVSGPPEPQHQQQESAQWMPSESQSQSLNKNLNLNAFLIECKRRGMSYKEIKRLGGFREAESTLRGRFRTLTKTKEERVRKPKWHERDIQLLCQAVAANAHPTPLAIRRPASRGRPAHAASLTSSSSSSSSLCFLHSTSTSTSSDPEYSNNNNNTRTPISGPSTSTTPCSSPASPSSPSFPLPHFHKTQHHRCFWNGRTTEMPKVSWKKVGQYIWAHGGSYRFGNATCKKKWCEIHGVRV